MPVFSRASARSAVSSPGRAASRGRSALMRVTARIVLPVTAIGGLAALSIAVPAASVAVPAASAATHTASVSPIPDVGAPIFKSGQFPAPQTIAECQADLGIACYTPVQYRVAYDLNPLYSGAATGRAITGAGETIVIVDSYGSPTIRNDLNVFDQQFGFPNPDLRIVKFGTIPAFDPTNSTMVGWAEETTLDVEYAHSIAPGAKIVLAETPVAETEGVTGLPQMMNAEESLINAGVGDVISQSFGATENTFPGFSSGNYSSLLNLRYAYQDALAHHVTVLAASGDAGATDDEADGSTLYPYRVNSWPSSDPLVTSVGGSQLYLDNAGNQLQPDSAWNDGYGAGGGGVSAVFSRPLYQARVSNVVGRHRGTPDISMSAAVNGGCWVYMSFAGIETSGVDNPGWYIFGGTSEATPIFSGIVALADQVAGHRLGLINPALYALGQASEHGASNTGLVDITAGNNSFAGVTGYDAGPGYDLASGWGTIDAAKFVPALARAAG
jgi:subtilase family serine protease